MRTITPFLGLLLQIQRQKNHLKLTFMPKGLKQILIISIKVALGIFQGEK